MTKPTEVQLGQNVYIPWFTTQLINDGDDVLYTPITITTNVINIPLYSKNLDNQQEAVCNPSNSSCYMNVIIVDDDVDTSIASYFINNYSDPNPPPWTPPELNV